MFICLGGLLDQKDSANVEKLNGPLAIVNRIFALSCKSGKHGMNGKGSHNRNQAVEDCQQGTLMASRKA